MYLEIMRHLDVFFYSDASGVMHSCKYVLGKYIITELFIIIIKVILKKS